MWWQGLAHGSTYAGRAEGANDADQGAERTTVPRGTRNSDGCPVSSILVAGMHGRQIERAWRRASRGAPFGSGLGGVSRQGRQGRRSRRVLHPSRRVTCSWARRGMRTALPLPRLELRRGRKRPRHHEYPGGQEVAEAEGPRLSGGGRGRSDLDLSRPEREPAGVPALRLHGSPRGQPRRSHVEDQCELGADARRRSGFLACQHPAYQCRATGMGRCLRQEGRRDE